MREYCKIYYAWGEKVRGEKYAYLIPALVRSNLKRKMTPQEGLLFISLMKRTITHSKKRRGSCLKVG